MEEEVDYGDIQDPQSDEDAPPPEDLYQDLFTDEGEGAGLLYLQNTELKQRTADQERIIAGLNAKVSQLTGERDKLQSERDVLLRNISCLFTTAQLELERKNAELIELRRERLNATGTLQEPAWAAAKQ